MPMSALALVRTLGMVSVGAWAMELSATLEN